mgnify:CR=1 FL=1
MVLVSSVDNGSLVVALLLLQQLIKDEGEMATPTPTLPKKETNSFRLYFLFSIVVLLIIKQATCHKVWFSNNS